MNWRKTIEFNVETQIKYKFYIYGIQYTNYNICCKSKKKYLAREDTPPSFLI